MTNSSEVKRYRVSTLPGRITRDCPEVVLASDFERVQRERDDWKAACLGHGEKASKLMRELDAARAEVARLRGAIEAHNYNAWNYEDCKGEIPLPGGNNA